MANYQKMTVQHFAENMKNGKYADLTAARRAIGKASWTKKEKSTAQAVAEKHFAGAPSSKKSGPKPSKAPTRQPVTSKAPRAEKAAYAPAAAPDAVITADLHYRAIGAISGALSALADVKRSDPKLDISEGQDVINTLTRTVRYIDEVDTRRPVTKAAAAPVVEPDPDPAPASQNGTGEELTEEEQQKAQLWARSKPEHAGPSRPLV